jgi:hypothetical protein
VQGGQAGRIEPLEGLMPAVEDADDFLSGHGLGSATQ